MRASSTGVAVTSSTTSGRVLLNCGQKSSEEAAVATGSVAMPSNDPAPSAGTAEQPGPNGSDMVMASVLSEVSGALLEVSVVPASVSASALQAASGRARRTAAAASFAPRWVRRFMRDLLISGVGDSFPRWAGTGEGVSRP